MGIPLRRELRAGLEPFALKDAPSFIEQQFPVGRLSAEAYKERKAGAGQTLTALGSYWKGRKPLVLVRAAVLGCLLPATDDPAKDLDIFLKLMAMDDEGLGRRVKNLKASDIDPDWVGFADIVSTDSGKPKWLQRLDDETIDRIVSEWFPTIPYERRIRYCLRPEELDDSAYVSIWSEVNAHLGTDAHSLPDLVEQLGIARFGHRPRVADTFCGGGSIPFEAARIGCDVYASDLNPIACMLTWGAFNIVGATEEKRSEIEAAQKAAAEAVDAEIARLGIEHDKHGNRAKAFLYCLETRCPRTGWMVPMAPSWVISKTHRVVAKLIPDPKNKRYQIEINSGVSDDEMAEATLGTVRANRLVHPANPEKSGVDLATIRGDYRSDGSNANALRLWEQNEFMPRPDDIYQERLYCIQWIRKSSFGRRRRQQAFYASVTLDDIKRENIVIDSVRKNLCEWQKQGLVPNMPIAPGEETTRLYRERGWTHWHHLFMPRQLLMLAMMGRGLLAEGIIDFTNELNFHSKLCAINSRSENSGRDMCLDRVFINQALNTLLNYGVRSFAYTAENSRVNSRHQTAGN